MTVARALAAAVVGAGLLAGCADRAEETAAAAHASARPHDRGPVVTGPVTGNVRVGLTEWTILLSRHVLPSGVVRLTVTNTGATEHDLVVQGDRGTWASPDLTPGQATTMRIRAVPGERLQMWCSMPGHRAQGMNAVVRVRRDGAATSAAASTRGDR